jgi:predicted PurR-regulated permease PerM
MAKDLPAGYEAASKARVNIAIFISIVALVIALICTAFTIGSRNIADQAQKTANSTKTYTDDTVKKALNSASKATNDAGPNNVQPPVNTTPNVNGQ